MIKHVVMWMVDAGDPVEKQKAVHEITEMLQGLVDKIPHVKTLEVGKNFNTSGAAFDVVLITSHDSRDALQKYRAHPDHVTIAEKIGELTTGRAVVDCEL